MKPYIKFLEHSSDVREMLDIYLELRQHFQELGFSESDLSKPPTYTTKMMTLFHKFGEIRDHLLKKIKSYGFEITFDELMNYINPLMEKINELTPLSKDGYNQRRNFRNED